MGVSATADFSSSTARRIEDTHSSLSIGNFEDLACIRNVPERLESVYAMISLIADMPGHPRPHASEGVDIVTGVVHNVEEFLFVVVGVGFYEGVHAVVEYNYLSLAGLNGNACNIFGREITNIQCLENSTDALIVNYTEQISIYGDRVEPDLQGSNTFVFAPNSRLLLNYTAYLHPWISQDIMDNGVISAKHMCAEAALRCEGDLFPYRDLEECYAILSSVPDACEVDCTDCWQQNARFQGDTRVCRNLHLVSAKLRPAVHCPHLADISEKCKPEHCPSAVRSPVSYGMSTFSPGLPLWLRISELIAASIIFFIPVFTYFWYRRLRKQMDSHPAQHQGKKADGTGPTVKLPVWRCSFVLFWKIPDDESDNGVVFQAESIELGGQKMVGIVGPSGCGKSSFLKLLCGYPQPHMRLELTDSSIDTSTRKCETAFSPQSTSMWPAYMLVRDILLFASEMHGAKLNEFSKCLDILQLRPLLDQTFSSLSGGQQQRVHLMASILRPKPSIIFLDEPLAALDENNAKAALTLLKSLPINHSFVMTIHQTSPALWKLFDRVLEIDVENKQIFSATQQGVGGHASSSLAPLGKETDTNDDTEIGEIPKHDDRNDFTPPFMQSLRALVILWHAQFWGWPAIEVFVFMINLTAGVLVGEMARESLQPYKLFENAISTASSTRIPLYMTQTLAAIVLITAFGVSSLFAGKEKHLLYHYCGQRDLNMSATLAVNVLRATALGLMQCATQILTSLAIMGLFFDEIDTVVMNGTLFIASFTLFCYFLSVLIPTDYAPHSLLMVIQQLFFFSGFFFIWDELHVVWQAIHYTNPFFYCISANVYMVLDAYNPNCGPIASPYLVCAPGNILIDITSIQKIPSWASQLFSLCTFVLSCFCLRWVLKPRPSTTRVMATSEQHLTVAKPRRWSVAISSIVEYSA